MIIEVVNNKLGERLTFDGPLPLVCHLWDRFKTRGWYLLEYDDVTIRAPDGWMHVYRGPYVLLHALTGTPLPGLDDPAMSIAKTITAVITGRDKT